MFKQLSQKAKQLGEAVQQAGSDLGASLQVEGAAADADDVKVLPLFRIVEVQIQRLAALRQFRDTSRSALDGHLGLHFFGLPVFTWCPPCPTK